MEFFAQSVSGLQISFSQGDRGIHLPRANETLEAVGLPNTYKIQDKVNSLLASKEHLKLLKGIAFIENLSVRETRKRLIRWMLLEYACRYSIAINENEILGTLGLLRVYIDDLLRRKLNKEDLILMICNEGFNIEKITFLSYWT